MKSNWIEANSNWAKLSRIERSITEWCLRRYIIEFSRNIVEWRLFMLAHSGAYSSPVSVRDKLEVTWRDLKFINSKLVRSRNCPKRPPLMTIYFWQHFVIFQNSEINFASELPSSAVTRFIFREDQRGSHSEAQNFWVRSIWASETAVRLNLAANF